MPQQGSGRPCGCDPGVPHTCEGHGNARDESETEAATGFYQEPEALQSFIAVVTGPCEDGQFGIMGPGGQWLWFERFEAEGLIADLQRRLSLRV